MDDKQIKTDLGELKVDINLGDLELKVDGGNGSSNSDVETLDFTDSSSNNASAENAPKNSNNTNSNSDINNPTTENFNDDIREIPDDSQDSNGGNEISNSTDSNHGRSHQNNSNESNVNKQNDNGEGKGEPAATASRNLNENGNKQNSNQTNKNPENAPNNKNDNLNNNQNNKEGQKNPNDNPDKKEGNNSNFQNDKPDSPKENSNPQQNNKAIDNKRNEAKQKSENLKNQKNNINKNNDIKNKLNNKGNKNFAKNYAKNKFNNTKLGSKISNVSNKVKKAQDTVKAVKNIKNIKNIAAIGGGLIAALPVIIGLLAAIFLIAIIMAVLSPDGNAASVSSSGYSEYTGGYYCTNITVSGTSYELDEYVARVVAQELGGANTEGLKAQAVLARTFVLNSTSDGDCTIGNSQNEQTLKTGDIDDKYREAAKATTGEVLTYQGKITGAYYATFPTGVEGSQDWGEGGCGAITCNNGSCTTKFYKYPSKTAWNFTMPEKNSAGNYWNGSSLQNQSGHCHGASQLGIMYYEEQGEKYDTILARFFDSDVGISKLETGTASAGAIAFQGAGTYKKQINYYNQVDYNTTGYCGRTPGAYAYYGCNANTICTSGCGGTSLAIVASTMKQDTSITPITIMPTIKGFGGCGEGVSGTTIQGIIKAAQTFGLKAYHTYDTKDVASKLSSGDYLVIANVTKSEFTGGGHYIVLSGYNNGQVYVVDPNGGAKTSMPNSQEIPSKITGRVRNGWWQESAVFDYATKNGYIVISMQ